MSMIPSHRRRDSTWTSCSANVAWLSVDAIGVVQSIGLDTKLNDPVNHDLFGVCHNSTFFSLSFLVFCVIVELFSCRLFCQCVVLFSNEMKNSTGTKASVSLNTIDGLAPAHN